MSIKKLSQHIINKISAGEVVSRPASVVKELVENSLDAGSTSIEIAIEEGGKKLIRITDNGHGIAYDELALALESHATSKLETDEHLFSIATLGFRGEAIASIASISQMTILSKPASAQTAGLMTCDGGVCSEVEPASSPVGTSIEVKHLFFNTPARRKFLKADSTELGHITDIVTKLAISHPAVQFKLLHNGKMVFNLPQDQDLSERIKSFYSKQLSGQLISVNRNEGAININGYIAPLNEARRNNRMQFFYLNGRFIRDKVVSHAIRMAFDGLVMPGSFPVLFLFMDMGPEDVDVNVHPMKSEVRFRASGSVHNILVHAIRESVSDSAFPTQMKTSDTHGFRPINTAPSSGHNPTNIREAMGSYLGQSKQQQFDKQNFFPQATPIGQGTPAIDNLATEPFRPPLSVEEGLQQPAGETLSYHQMFNTYIIEELAEGICLTDQHALHERILFEEISQRIDAGPLESQQLLIAEPITLDSEADAKNLLDHAKEFARFGFDIAPFDNRSIVLQAVPKMLRKFNASDLFKQLASDLESTEKSTAIEDLQYNLIATMACKAAVKAGDKLSQEEMRYLIENKELAFLRHSCPHGRPTTLFLPMADIERQFKRTV